MKDVILRSTLPLNARSLICAAQRTTGFDDFGPPVLQPSLEALLDACESETRLSLFGRLAMRGDIKRMLTNRLYMQADRRRQPGISKEQIKRPLFITGLPRTGTTLLHALLARDPAHRAPLTWETMYPSPPPFEQGDNDGRIARTTRQLRWLDRLVPRFKKIHEVGAELPQECVAITAHTFLSLRFLITHRLPGYAEYLSRTDGQPAYEFHRYFLQHLQFNAPPRRWVLKAPAHLPSLDELLAVYPDAMIVQTHRDPLDSIPSLASLRTALRSCFADDIDPAVTGSEVARYWAEALERAEAVRRRASSSSFYDVRYEDLVGDPIGTIRGLYLHFGLDFNPTIEARLRSYLDAHPQGKHGRHDYQPAHFGFECGSIQQTFSDYRARMGWTDEAYAGKALTPRRPSAGLQASQMRTQPLLKEEQP